MINLIQTLAISERKITTKSKWLNVALCAWRFLYGDCVMNFLKEALLAVSAATWIVGLVDQFRSWTMTAFYIVISLVMIAVTLGNRLMLRLALRRDRRR